MRQREFEALVDTRNRELHCGVTTDLAVALVGAVHLQHQTVTLGSLFDRYPRQSSSVNGRRGVQARLRFPLVASADLGPAPRRSARKGPDKDSSVPGPRWSALKVTTRREPA